VPVSRSPASVSGPIGPSRRVRFTADGLRDYRAFYQRAPSTVSAARAALRKAGGDGLRTAVSSPLDEATWYWRAASPPENRVGFLLRLDNHTAWVVAVVDTRRVLQLPSRP
jgi:hypothetical protein